jgi:hypothetical protein
MGKLSQEEFIKRCNIKHNNAYSYDKTVYKTTRDKIIVTCPIHGDFITLADNHIRKSGCPKCGAIAGSKHTTLSYKEFTDRVKAVGILHLEFNKHTFKNSREPVEVRCTKHNTTFFQAPYNIQKGHAGCKECQSEKLSSNKRSSNQRFIQACKNIYGDRLMYDHVNYVINTSPVTVVCNYHGEFAKTPKELLQGSNCPVCMKEDVYKNNASSFLEKFQSKWPSYEVKSEYKGSFAPIVIECKEHGEFEVTPEQCRTRLEICEKCRTKNGSTQERMLFEFLENNNIKFYPRYKLKVDRKLFEVDVFLPNYNLAIEINGLYWHREQEGTRYTKNYHLDKTVNCQKLGVTLLHFYDTEINEKFDIIKSIITNKIGLNSKKVYARKTIVRYITKNEKKAFLNTYHLQGNDRSSIYLGLFREDELVSVMTFGNRKITGRIDHELMRFCVKSDVTVVGGFSKLLKRYKKDHNITTIKTYADRRYSDGEVYKKNGFKFIKYSAPSYWYFTSSEYKLLHRYNFAKHTLKNKSLIYDDNLTEKEIMRINGYHRIWDCGQCVFTI